LRVGSAPGSRKICMVFAAGRSSAAASELRIVLVSCMIRAAQSVERKTQEM